MAMRDLNDCEQTAHPTGSLGLDTPEEFCELGYTKDSAELAPSHGHLWLLLDGTPAHAPVGVLTRNVDGELACHLCGKWFVHLGLHLRGHGWTARQYRAAVDLPRHLALCSPELSGNIADRQQRAYESKPELREHFEHGHKLARSGRLAQLAADAHRERERNGQNSEAVAVAQRLRLTQGRTTVAAQRRYVLDDLIGAVGTSSLHGLLRDQYGAGASLEDLGRITGLGRARLRSELRSAAVAVRPTGANQLASKRARAARNNDKVAALVGTNDIVAWLRGQRAAGITMAQLAEQCSRSLPWIRSRLKPAVTVNHGATVEAQPSLSCSPSSDTMRPTRNR